MRMKRRALAGAVGLLMVAATTSAVAAPPMAERSPVVSVTRNTAEDQPCSGEADEHTPGETYTAAAPTKCDRPGLDQDGYYIPKFTHPQYNFGDYRVDGKTLGEGYHKLKSGASSVTVTTDYDSGSWTFNFTDVDVEREAKNTYSVEVGEECMKSDGVNFRWRTVTAYFTNTLESDLPEGVTEGPAVNSIYPFSEHQVDMPISAVGTERASNIADGQTVAMRIMRDKDRAQGLDPGTYIVEFWRADKGYADRNKDYMVKRMKVEVPKCGKGGSGSDAPPPSFNVTGSLSSKTCTRVKAVVDAREFSGSDAVPFKFISRFSGRKAQKRGEVESGAVARLIGKKPRSSGASFLLSAKDSNGDWVRLARRKAPAC